MDARLGIDDRVGLKMSGLWPADGWMSERDFPCCGGAWRSRSFQFTSRIGAWLV